MSPLKKCILEKATKPTPIWLMRQAGRYLPEFREIRLKNPNFINLCLNDNLSSEITLQPLKRFDFDAAIIFSDILMLPFGIGQNVEFIKNFGPVLGELNLEESLNVTDTHFTKKLYPVYKAIRKVSEDRILHNKDLIGFVGAPWTLLVYMLNKQSPKQKINNLLLDNNKLINDLLKIIDKFLKLHIKNQVDNGASVIQIFDSWAGLVENKDLAKYIYDPTVSLVEYVKSLGIPVICFPRNIKNYKEYVKIVRPDVINIDYEVDPKKILTDIDIIIQGGLDPKKLLNNNEDLKRETLKYLEVFKDRPYIFNLGHGVLPETKPSAVEYLVKIVKNY